MKTNKMTQAQRDWNLSVRYARVADVIRTVDAERAAEYETKSAHYARKAAMAGYIPA